MIWRIMAFALVGTTAGVLGYWLTDRIPPTEIISWKLLTPQVQPGGELRIAYDVYRNRACRTKYQRTYRDGGDPPVRYILEDIDIWSSPANPGPDRYTTAIPISVKAQKGKTASFRPINIYICNPIHWIWPITQLPGNIDFEIAGDPVAGQIEVIPRR